MLFLTVERVYHSLGSNKWGDTHDTPAFEQLILCKEGDPDINKVAIFKSATSKYLSILKFS